MRMQRRCRVAGQDCCGMCQSLRAHFVLHCHGSIRESWAFGPTSLVSFKHSRQTDKVDGHSELRICLDVERLLPGKP